MKIQLPPPDKWDDFEDLCFDLWKSIWGDPYISKNGRAGQKQHGVDIFGIPYYQTEYDGIQCKCKENFQTGKKLTTNEITKEANNAKQFQPSIKNFIIATTSLADAKLQQHCRLIEKDYPFHISVRDWNYIASEIQSRKELLRKFYTGEAGLFSSSAIKLSILDDLTIIFGFLDRDLIKLRYSAQVRLIMGKLMIELADNAFRHGNASFVTISYADNFFYLSDNGNEFDISKLNFAGHGGTETLNELKRMFKNCNLDIKSEFVDNENKYTFKLLEPVSSGDYNIIECIVSKHMTRQDAVNHAIHDVGELIKSHSKCKLLLTEPIVISSALAYCNYLFDNALDKIESVCLPNSQMYSLIIEKCKKNNIKYILR